MRQRLLFLLLSCACLVFSTTSPADTRLEQQRVLFSQAKTALDKGKADFFLQNKARLKGYPLTPYLVHNELKARLQTAQNQEVESFLLEHGDLPQIRMFKLEWLKLLAARQEWALFLKYYNPDLNLSELDCLAGQAHLHFNLKQTAYRNAEKLWMSSASRPNACDPLFEAWNKAGLRTPEKIWQRLLLAVEARNYGLAKFLIKEHPQPALAQKLLDVAQKPALVKNPKNFDITQQQTSAIVAIGLRRLFRDEVDTSLDLLEKYNQLLAFTKSEKAKIARDIGVMLAKRFDSRALAIMQQWEAGYNDPLVAEWNARLLLRLGRWSETNQFIQKLPPEIANTNRWRYWQIRSAQIAQPLNKISSDVYQELAKERDFYAFMAADHNQSPYQLNHNPIPVNPKTLNKVRQTLGIQRAYELYALGDLASAQREWHHASRIFSKQELLAQARLAYDMDWFNPAIRTLAQAQYWDDLEIRFPMAFRGVLTDAAQNQGLHSSWVYAITRQESAFSPNIRSHAGAMGLMQLMPATAMETARRYNIPLKSPQQALNPQTNAQLGTAYLHQMMQQFNGNRILASAAYNAGPGRVRHWLKDAQHLPYDIWIETIPFDETRQYVQNVLTYSVIYGEKLKAPTPLVEWHEKLLETP